MVEGLLIIALIMIAFGLCLALYGFSDYEDGIGMFGVLLLVIGMVMVITTVLVDDSTETTDKHVKITYEDLCYEYGGEFMNFEGKNTCIVEE